MSDWSKLPEELLGVIAARLFSMVEFKRFRSICKSWRASVSGTNKNLFLSCPLIKFKPLQCMVSSIQANEQSLGLRYGPFLSRAAFFRVTLSSSRDQGWLIKSDKDLNSGKFHLLNSLSRLALRHSCKRIDLSCKRIDLSEFIFSEIQEAYAVLEGKLRKTARGFQRVFLVRVPGGDHRVLVIGIDGVIRYWKDESWMRVEGQVDQFSDIELERGLTYALDTKGSVWWISSSYDISRFGPSIYKNITNRSSGEKRFVRCRGVLYIVDRLIDENLLKRKADSLNVLHDDVGNVSCEVFERDRPKTIGFKVYKMDDELVKWVEVKSLGDNAVMMATDTCFSVLAHEFYGCLPNSIYFTDKEKDEIKVFKLDDGSITTMSKSEKSCFQMFVPSFL
ncbi:F-box protein At2g17690 isoform X3 [Arabidopsis lyrata subsp. lyrata]|uniref:F-box protein At2g17690 isoform X3 n=1 Tax=Arabidopsis lyrata subsp. lyrata TaxID=81972 RepID=UPI000A29E94A|nr:F-box protein At2g17690 isoform X3 [Arabidopsis lyrata subsp. lyrata]|eukprot:XP_020887342.1 F-box protein At2g17690 isoform X3 [Arabidopsis lyrata subsp. lyrata]